MDLTKTLYYKEGNDTYFLAGKTYDYFYSGGYEPNLNDTCSDILEKLLFVYELWLQSGSGEFFEKELPEDLTSELTEFFEEYDEPDFAYFEILEFIMPPSDKFINCSGEINELTGQLVLKSGKFRLYIPAPYSELSCYETGDDLSGEPVETLKKVKKFSFNLPDGSDGAEWLFMNEAQLKASHKNLDYFLNAVIQIFSKNGYQMKTCEDLIRFILS